MSEVVLWVDADGGSTTLEVEWDASGRFAPKTVFDEDVVPGQPGARFRAVRHELREFVLPIWMVADTEALLRTAMRDMVARMDPTRGPGVIRTTTPVGDQREIACFYGAGLEMAEKLGQSSGPTMQLAPVMFRAYDPYWSAVSTTVQDFTIGAMPSFFPFFPLRLTASEIAVDTTVTNSGDVDTWPVWTITGPGSGIVLRNLTTGKDLTPSGITLAAGQTVIIDTRPGVKTVTRDDGTNLWPYLSNTSALWPLRRGVNSVRLEMSASTSASALRLSYKPRYLSP